MNAKSVHTYPVNVPREHVTHGLDCWCNPLWKLPCDECENGCWKCDRGLIPLTREEAEAAEDPLVIVHNDEQ